MKKHICKRILELERMAQQDAEKKLNKKISNLTFGTDGYLFLDLSTMKIDWTPKELLGDVRPYESFTDMIKNDIAETEERLDYFKRLMKSTFPGEEMKNRARIVKRRLGTLVSDLKALLEIANKYEE